MAILNAKPILPFRGAAPESPPITARQNPVVTQTITRPYTTITAVVTLGPGSTSSPPLQQATTTSTIQTSASFPSYPSSTVAIPGTPPASSTTLTHAQLGAILGSIFGSILLVILIWYCVSQSRRRREAEEEEARFRYVLSGESETTSEETAEVRVRQGGTRRMGGMGWWMGTGAPWASGGGGRGGGVGTRGPEVISVVPPPPRFPPTPRYTPYRQTRNPQIRGVRRYP